jgi:hypothetical protein
MRLQHLLAFNLKRRLPVSLLENVTHPHNSDGIGGDQIKHPARAHRKAERLSKAFGNAFGGLAARKSHHGSHSAFSGSRRLRLVRT